MVRPRHEGLCRVAPSPDLLARYKAWQAQGQNVLASLLPPEDINIFSGGTGSKPGLNEGPGTLRGPAADGQNLTGLLPGLDAAPFRGVIKALVVLVEFSDQPMATGKKQYFQDLFFSTGKVPTGSVNDYYKDVSGGAVSFTGEVVGPLMMPKKMTDYANNASGLGSEPNIQTMAADAILASNGTVNFAQYDNDHDGEVEAFIVVHAGRGAEQTGKKTDIWSAKWDVPRNNTVDGVKVSTFLTIPEDALIGVCSHELGHLVFGWPDLYDTDDSSSGIGGWCLMSAGSWGGSPQGSRPCHPSAWCKATQGWITVQNHTENGQVTCADVKTSKSIHRLWKNGDTTSKEYFLCENRQLVGYDASLPGGGLLVWHIDDSVSTNQNEAHPKVKLIQADNRDQLLQRIWWGDGGDPYPGTANNRSFSITSMPSSKSYLGADTNVSITALSDSGPSMTFQCTVKPVVASKLSGKTWYRLRNTLSGYALDVVNDGRGSPDGFIQMAREGNFSGQHWQIRDYGNGSYSLCTMFLGAGKQLDVYGDDKTKPHLATKGNFSGQFWQITPWGDGTFYLTNSYSGADLALDTVEGGTKVSMNSRNIGRPTQRWMITPIRAITEPGFPETQ